MKKITVITFAITFTIALINLIRIIVVLLRGNVDIFVCGAILIVDILLGVWCVYEMIKNGKGDSNGNQSKGCK